MSRMLSLLGALLLTLTLAACAGAAKSESDSCQLCASGCMAGKTAEQKKECMDGKAMECCRKEAKKSCCSKGAAEGKPGADHQH